MSAAIPAGCSPLATYYNEAKYYTKTRNATIDTITIHCYVGQVTAQRGCDGFANRTEDKAASCNYVVGYDGSIGVSVPESGRSWCTSSSANDNRAITFEIASESEHPYKVTEEAYDAMIKLLADVCKRNNIKRLVWSTDKNERMQHLNGCNMTVHRDYANKACPGDYLYNKHGEIADAVNKLLFPAVYFENFTLKNTNKTSVETSMKVMEAFDQYTWSYSATNLLTGKVTSGSFSMRSQTKTLTVSGLLSNTPYTLEIKAKNAEGEVVKSPSLFFSTLKNRPGELKSATMQIEDPTDLKNTYCNISVGGPDSWGDDDKATKGISVFVAVNGKIDSENINDSWLSPNVTSKRVKVSDLFKNIQIKYGDSFQVGAQAWVKNSSGPKQYSEHAPVFSDTFYYKPPADEIHSAFISVDSRLDRAVVARIN